MRGKQRRTLKGDKRKLNWSRIPDLRNKIMARCPLTAVNQGKVTQTKHFLIPRWIKEGNPSRLVSSPDKMVTPFATSGKSGGTTRRPSPESFFVQINLPHPSPLWEIPGCQATPFRRILFQQVLCTISIFVPTKGTKGHRTPFPCQGRWDPVMISSFPRKPLQPCELQKTLSP